MKAPTCIKDVQKLTGCMAALNRFISKLGEWGLPFFKLPKHQEKFVWTPEVDQALAQLKDFLSKPPVLTAPRKGEQLLLYLAATTHMVSIAIIVERQEDDHAYPVQHPVLITSRKLRHYFQEYSISVVTDYPLSDILRNQDATGRISKWAVELGALNIDFKTRTTMKSQALVDFMAEWQENQIPTPTECPEHWVMYFDGSLKLEGAGAGVLLISTMGEQLKYVLQIFWKVPNNEAEYEALLQGLRLVASLGIKRLLVYGDSVVVINQDNKSWDRNKKNMDPYWLEVRKLENKFYGLEFHHVVLDNNVATDVLSKLGSTRAQVPAGVFVHELHAPSIPELAPPTTDPAHPPTGQEVMMINADGRQPFIDYLSEQKVPSDKNLAEQLIRRAKSYVLVGDKLYRRGASSGVLMKCVPREEGKGILEEIHKGVCGNHASSRTLVSKVFRRAFYWPTALGDAEELVRRCQGCQYFSKQQHVSAYRLVTIPPTWPFACWGLGMIGPLPTAPGGFNRVLVAIYKFTKWIEVHLQMNSYIITDYPTTSSQTWPPTSTITSSGSPARTAGSTSDMSQLPILGPMDKSSAQTGWCLMLSRSGYTTLPTTKEASGSRNYQMRFGGYVLNPPSRWDNHHTSWSTAPKQSFPLMSCGTHQQSSNTTKAYPKTAGDVPPSSNQQGTSRVSDVITTATSRNAPSTLVILSSTASRTRKDYTSSARPGKVPSQLQR
jgi:ribonuclease HI